MAPFLLITLGGSLLFAGAIIVTVNNLMMRMQIREDADYIADLLDQIEVQNVRLFALDRELQSRMVVRPVVFRVGVTDLN